MKEEINVGIASIPTRERALEQVLNSLTNQVDHIYVALNGYDKIDSWINQYSNVTYFFTGNENGDAEKFHYAPLPDCYYLALDDDLAVKDGYVQYMINAVDKYNGLVSLHGRTYLPPVTNFKKWAGNYRCLNRVSEDVKVNFIGSGCCAFHTGRLKVNLSDFKRPNMADVFLSKLATEQGVPMVVLKHEMGEFLEYLPPQGNTIWQTTKDHSYHVSVMRTFIK